MHRKGESIRSEKTHLTVQRYRALELRKAGATFAKIGEALDVTRQRAHALVSKAIDDLNAKSNENTDQIIRLELERLDALWMKSHSLAQQGDVAAINACLRIMERRARLLGLDAQPGTDIHADVEINITGLPAAIDVTPDDSD